MAEEEKSTKSGGKIDIATINRLLVTGLTNGASDIHFRVGEPPLYRVDGALKELKFHELTPDDTRLIAKELLKEDKKSNLDSIDEYDATYIISGKGQFRMNIYKQLGAFAVILRVIPYEISSFQELKLPPVLNKIANEERGLVLPPVAELSCILRERGLPLPLTNDIQEILDFYTE